LQEEGGGKKMMEEEGWGEIHRNKNVSESKNGSISHLFDLIKVSRVPLEIGLCHHLMELRFFSLH